MWRKELKEDILMNTFFKHLSTKESDTVKTAMKEELHKSFFGNLFEILIVYAVSHNKNMHIM